MPARIAKLLVVVALVLHTAGAMAIAGITPVDAPCTPHCSADQQTLPAQCPSDGQHCPPQAGCLARCATERNFPVAVRVPHGVASVLVVPVPHENARQPASAAAAAPFRPPRNRVSA